MGNLGEPRGGLPPLGKTHSAVVTMSSDFFWHLGLLSMGEIFRMISTEGLFPILCEVNMRENLDTISPSDFIGHGTTRGALLGNASHPLRYWWGRRGGGFPLPGAILLWWLLQVVRFSGEPLFG